jgi:glycosyltransferase involved in cell wall biosynthesis
LNIVVCTQSFPRFSGDVNAPFIFNLAKALAKDEKITIIAPHHASSAEYEEWEDIPIHRFRYASDKREVMAYTGSMHKVALKPWNWLLSWSFLRNASKAIRVESAKISADVLYAHWILPSGMFTAKARKGEKLVIHVHGTDFNLMRKSRLLRRISIGILRKADGIICVSNEQEQVIKRLVNCPVTVESMGVDLSLFNAKPKEEFNKKVLFVGRITQAKGVDHIVAAARIMPDWNFTIVGDGPYLPQLKEGAAGLLNMAFSGAVANHELPKYYHEADLFLLPSQREGMPVSIIESLACGTPVIATDVGQISELIINGENGQLIDESAESIEVALNSIATQGTWQQMSRNAAGSVSDRDMNEVAKRISSFMEGLL